MKKFFIILIIFMLLPITVNAEKVDYVASKNLSWQGGLPCTFEADGDKVKITNISASYCSPYFDVLPAFKEAIGNKRQITMEVTIKIRADLKNKNASSKFHLNIRCFTDTQNANMWREHHKNGACCNPPFFDSSTNNIMYSVNRSSSPLKNEWATYSFLITASSEQISCPVSPNWFLCLDGLEPALLNAIYIDDVTLSVYNAYSVTPKPTAVAQRTARPVMTITTPAPTVTPSPTPAPTPDWLGQPIMEDMTSMVEDVAKYTFNIIIAVGIFYLCIAYKINKNKK